MESSIFASEPYSLQTAYTAHHRWNIYRYQWRRYTSGRNITPWSLIFCCSAQLLRTCWRDLKWDTWVLFAVTLLDPQPTFASDMRWVSRFLTSFEYLFVPRDLTTKNVPEKGFFANQSTANSLVYTSTNACIHARLSSQSSVVVHVSPFLCWKFDGKWLYTVPPLLTSINAQEYRGASTTKRNVMWWYAQSG